MNKLEREYIAIGFNNDTSKIIPVIRMSGSDGLKKVIRGVGGIRNIGIYHIDFQNQTTENIGNINWPDYSLTSDVVIQYEPEGCNGTVHIMELNQTWSYSVNNEIEAVRDKKTGKSEISVRHETAADNEKKQVLDRDKVRQLAVSYTHLTLPTIA